MTKMYLISSVTFTRNEVSGTHLGFSKEEISRFHIESGGSLGRKVHFFQLRTTKISRSLRLSVYINVVLLINFPEQFELCFYFKYSRSYKVYNLGDKTFETDFRSVQKDTEASIPHNRPVKLIQRVKIAHSFLQSVSSLFHFIILSLHM